jgi:hypothetical protein
MGLAFPKTILKQNLTILYRFAKITKLGLIYHIRSYSAITTKDDAIQKN